MGKSTKKTASKADAAAAPTKPSKKGKRGAKGVIDNDNCKKRKKDLVEENKTGAKATITFIKENEDNSVDQIKDHQVKVSAEINPIDSNPRLDDENSGVKTDACAGKETRATENGHIDESEKGPPEEESEGGEPQKKKVNVPPYGTINPVGSNSKASEDDGSGKEESSEKEEPSKLLEVEKLISGSKENNSSEEISSDEDIAASSDEAEAEMAATPKEQPAGSKTLFIGNLSFSIKQVDVENFFKDAGEIVGVRLAKGSDSSLRGFGHVEFSTAEGAIKALNELDAKDLLGRPVRLALAKERGSNTPNSGEKEEVLSFQKGGRAPRQTIFVRGFNKDDGEDQISNALEDHFGSCGEITRVSVPKDKESGGVRGIAYIDFKDYDAYNKALEFNGSKFRDNTLTVEAANPRDDGFDSGRRGGLHSGRGSGGRFNGHHHGGLAGRGHLSGRGRAAPRAKHGGS